MNIRVLLINVNVIMASSDGKHVGGPGQHESTLLKYLGKAKTTRSFHLASDSSAPEKLEKLEKPMVDANLDDAGSIISLLAGRRLCRKTCERTFKVRKIITAQISKCCFENKKYVLACRQLWEN